MLSDEEKKAIDYFRNKIGDFELFYGKKITTQENEYLKILLNLIEKQQKEIEELKAINKKLEARKYMLNTRTGEVTAIPIDNNYINKDKIKAKIEEVDENGYWEFLEKRDEDKCKDILQSLLEK